MATAKAKGKGSDSTYAIDTSPPQERVDAEIVEEGHEQQPSDEVIASGEHFDFDASDENRLTASRSGAPGEPVVMPAPSTMLNPNVSEEEQGMEMRPTVVGPPAYGSPDAITSAGRLLPLNTHPLSADVLPEDHPAAISPDYAEGYDGTLKGVQTITSSPSAPQTTKEKTDGEEVDATAGAQELAEQEGVDLSEVEGSGEGGRITKADVEQYLSDQESNQ